ncbi:MAG TPA: antibiotic biosynthesis monooxygenase [Burkholderiaceae bacterium]|nr:antibiotic biosynthesis monooxygenase [Burkholderiaceae bacterium]
MIAVIFEVLPQDGRADDYFAIAGHLKPLLEQVDGFISVERFESLATPGKFLSLSFWRDEAAVRRWRDQAPHRTAQQAGRERVFRDYRLRVARVVRDYGMYERAEVPDDSQAVHPPLPGPSSPPR